jgi:hypothetical protein
LEQQEEDDQSETNNMDKLNKTFIDLSHNLLEDESILSENNYINPLNIELDKSWDKEIDNNINEAYVIPEYTNTKQTSKTTADQNFPTSEDKNQSQIAQLEAMEVV